MLTYVARYVWVYVCYVLVCVKRIYIYICFLFAHVYMYECMNVCMYVCIYACTYVYLHMHMHIRVFVYVLLDLPTSFFHTRDACVSLSILTQLPRSTHQTSASNMSLQCRKLRKPFYSLGFRGSGCRGLQYTNPSKVWPLDPGYTGSTRNSQSSKQQHAHRKLAL